MNAPRQLFAFYTEPDPKTESLLDKLAQKLRGKKFSKEGKYICVFPKAAYAVQAAMFYLKKCHDAGLSNSRVVVLSGTQASLFKDGLYLYKNAMMGQCWITEEIYAHIKKSDIITELSGDVSLPASQANTQVHTLEKYNDISIDEQDHDDLFDYSNVEVPAQPAPSDQEPEPEPVAQPVQEEKPASVSMTDESLEISQVNQIYDYQNEVETMELQNPSTHADEDLDSDILSTSEAGSDPSPSAVDSVSAPIEMDVAKPLEEPEPQPHAFEELGQPEPMWKDLKLMLTFVVAIVSLALIGIYAFGGGDASTDQERGSDRGTVAEQRDLSSNVQDQGNTDPKAPPKPAPAPKKRTFAPILTEKESKKDQASMGATLFPQQVGDDTAFLEIQSNPPGAFVTINGARLKGVTPMKTFLVFANQKLAIKISKPGYETVTKNESIPAGKRKGFIFELIRSDG